MRTSIPGSSVIWYLSQVFSVLAASLQRFAGVEEGVAVNDESIGGMVGMRVWGR